MPQGPNPWSFMTAMNKKKYESSYLSEYPMPIQGFQQQPSLFGAPQTITPAVDAQSNTDPLAYSLTNTNAYSPNNQIAQTPPPTTTPLPEKKSKFQFGINYDHILGSQMVKSFASLVAQNGSNSSEQALRDFNNQYNNLPYTPNNSTQALYGMKKGGGVGMKHICKYDTGGGVADDSVDDSSDTEDNWIMGFNKSAIKAEPTVEDKSKNLDAAVQDIVDPTDEEKYNDIFRDDEAYQSYSKKMRAGAASEDLTPKMSAIMGKFQQMFPGIVVTSTTGGKHMNGSRHYEGKAIDIGANSSDKASYKAMWDFIKANPGVKQAFGIEDIINEGDHTHIELPKNEDGGPAGVCYDINKNVIPCGPATYDSATVPGWYRNPRESVTTATARPLDSNMSNYMTPQQVYDRSINDIDLKHIEALQQLQKEDAGYDAQVRQRAQMSSRNNSMYSKGGLTQGQELDLPEDEINNLIKQGYKIQKLK